ncbi:GDSL esterase/lipase, partial [Trifolium pratense]
MKLNLKIVIHGLHRTSSSTIAIKAVRNRVAYVGGNGSKIWLAGHSLGSCVALLAGKAMAKSGILYEVHDNKISLLTLVYLLNFYTRNDAYHRKSIAASLVKGVYVLEKDRQEHRKGPMSLAPPWWTTFHFQLIDTLVDDD